MLLLIVEVVLIFGFGYTYAQDVRQVYPFPGCEDETIVLRHIERPQYEDMMKEIFMRGYEVDVYDCSNMSIDLASYLNNRGYDSRVECGWDDERAHAWVELKLYLDPSINVIHKQQPSFPSYTFSEELCDS